MGTLRVYNLGRVGVDVDSDDIHGQEGAFRRAQNLHRDPLGSADAVVNRPGLTAFTTVDTAGVVLGGIGVPLQDQLTGSLIFFILRGGPRS